MASVGDLWYIKLDQVSKSYWLLKALCSQFPSPIVTTVSKRLKQIELAIDKRHIKIQ